MRIIRQFIFISFLCILTSLVFGQTGSFPDKWQGKWKGELLWYQQGFNEPKRVGMQLTITKADGFYHWLLVYENNSRDTRPYKLVPANIDKGHWKIDEDNGIVIDMYYVADRLAGSFTVGSSSILTSYWLEDDNLIVEFYNTSPTPISITGEKTDASPEVKSFFVKSYQKAILSRQR